MTKMYPERKKNIPVFRSCFYSCCYCAFQKFQKISKCQKCRAGENHTHLEVLKRTPPKTKESEFLTVGLSGDVSFMDDMAFRSVISYCQRYSDRTFLIQSKNPEYFLKYLKWIPDNLILGTTIESNVLAWVSKDGLESYDHISKAPLPEKRYEAMVKLNCKKAVTCEPLLDFDLDIMLRWMKDIAPEFIYIGYNNHNHKLPEPSLEKTLKLITKMRESGIDVREKSIIKAWWEK